MAGPTQLSVIPLGGLGEVGMNCLVLDCDGQLLVIDCGVNFPGDDYGVDVVHPDFSWLEDNWDRLLGVFLTHGHEDHIGALPYLVRQRPLPIWGPPHALSLVERRFDEHGLELAEEQLSEVRPGRIYDIGPFAVEPVRVSHSIVEATALSITTPAGTLVHSGDFKFDPHPSDGQPTDEERLLEIGYAGVDLLLSDSTNVDSTGSSGSERDVEDGLDAIIKGAKRRVFVALFSSNVQRLISLGRIAERRGRRICLLGRSLQTHVQVARELGYLNWPRDMLLPVERLRTYPKAEVLVLATGTQAEPAAALARLSRGEHRWVDLDPGDTVIMSSRIIPGCDRQVVDMMGDLLRRGVKLESRWTAGVHTSGHANREEQQRLIELLQPKNFVPVHGTLHHLTRHAELARSAGVERALVVENGQSVILSEGSVRRGADVPTGKVFVAIGGGALQPDILEGRRQLGRHGVLSISLLRGEKGKLCRHPKVVALGLPHLDSEVECADLGRAIEDNWRTLQRASSGKRRSSGPPSGDSSGRGWDRSSAFGLRFLSSPHNRADALLNAVERFVQRWADEHFGLRPLVVVHVEDALGNK